MNTRNLAFAPPPTPLGNNAMAEALSAFVPAIVADTSAPVAGEGESVSEAITAIAADDTVVEGDAAAHERMGTFDVLADLAAKYDMPKPAPSVDVAPAKPAEPKVHRGRAPKHAKPTVLPPETAKATAKVLAHVAKPKSAQVPQAPKTVPVTDMNPQLAVEELLSLPGEDLVRETRRLIAAGQTPVFSFELKSRQTSLVMSVAPVSGDAIRLTVENGRGGLLQGFPKGTSFALAEVRGPVYEGDVTRLKLVANFRGALIDLLMQNRSA